MFINDKHKFVVVSPYHEAVFDLDELVQSAFDVARNSLMHKVTTVRQELGLSLLPS